MRNTVAQTILAQLGGGVFQAMTGAKNLTASEDTLTFGIGRNSQRINRVEITLNASDTYDLKFWRITKKSWKVVKEISDIYVSELREVFTDTTGLETSI